MVKTAEQYLSLTQKVKDMKLIRYRKDRGHWQTSFRVNGRKIQKKIPLLKKSEKKQAREYAEILYLQMMKGEILNECKTTFKEAWEMYADSRKTRDVGKNYRRDIIFEFIGDKKLDEIDWQDYEHLKKYLKTERKCLNQSINRYYADIRAVLNYAKKKRIIKDFPPLENLPKEKSRRPKPKALSFDELNAIYNSLPDYLKDPFEFGWRTGLRLRNIRELQRRHLSKAEDGTYTITIPAEEFKRGVIHHHYCTKEETEIIKRNISLEHSYIFRRMKKVNGAKTNNIGDFKKAKITSRKRVGFYWTWHWLRHTRATLYASEFTDKQMNALMGWSPNSRISGNYSHLRNEADIKAWREADSKRIGDQLVTKAENSKEE